MLIFILFYLKTELRLAFPFQVILIFTNSEEIGIKKTSQNHIQSHTVVKAENNSI